MPERDGNRGGDELATEPGRSWWKSVSVGSTAVDLGYAALAPVAFGVADIAARVLGATPRERLERAGELPAAPGPLFWFHGASAGEMAAAAKLAALLRREGFPFTAGYTTTNRAGVELASRLDDPTKIVALAPWDTPGAVRRAFDRWRPAALFLVETELWPGLIREAHRRRVPVLSVSARIYPRDVRRYGAIRGLMRPTLRRLTAVLAQDETECERFAYLGVPAARCMVGGNLKHLDVDETVMDVEELRRELGVQAGEHIVVGGSIHADEVELLFAAFDAVESDPVRFIVAPRHHQVAHAIVRAARQRDWCVHHRSNGPAMPGWRVLVLDTMGELRSAYSLAAVAIVGGGFGTHGGHNLFEPVRAGAPVVFGIHCAHVAREAGALASVVPAARVDGAFELGRRLREWLTDGERRQRVLAAQRTVLPAAAAVAERYRAMLTPLLAGVRT